MVSLVIDSGRLNWRIGDAGDDSASSFTCRCDDCTAADAYPAHGDARALQARWESNLSLLKEYVHMKSLQQEDGVQEEDEQFDGSALFTCSACDDSQSQHIRDILSAVYSPESTLGITYCDIVPQEILILCSSGRTTGLVVNLGFDVTVVGVSDGQLLGETVRRVMGDTVMRVTAAHRAAPLAARGSRPLAATIARAPDSAADAADRAACTGVAVAGPRDRRRARRVGAARDGRHRHVRHCSSPCRSARSSQYIHHSSSFYSSSSLSFFFSNNNNNNNIFLFFMLLTMMIFFENSLLGNVCTLMSPTTSLVECRW